MAACWAAATSQWGTELSISLKANAAGTQGEILLNGVPALQIDSLTNTIKALAPFTLEGNGPAFSGRGASPASPVSGTNTKIDLTADFDTSNCFDAVNSRFVPQVPGYYQINAAVFGLAAAAGLSYIAAMVFRNGVNIGIADQRPTGATSARVAMSMLVFMNGTTDYIELWGNLQGTNVTFGGGVSIISGVLVRQP